MSRRGAVVPANDADVIVRDAGEDARRDLIVALQALEHATGLEEGRKLAEVERASALLRRAQEKLQLYAAQLERRLGIPDTLEHQKDW